MNDLGVELGACMGGNPILWLQCLIAAKQILAQDDVTSAKW